MVLVKWTLRVVPGIALARAMAAGEGQRPGSVAPAGGAGTAGATDAPLARWWTWRLGGRLVRVRSGVAPGLRQSWV